MKIRLLLACFVMVMASCSNDDDKSNSNPNDGNTAESRLGRIIQTEFNPDGSVKLTSKTYFEDDRAILLEEYNGLDELTAKSGFTYNNSGSVETMLHYSAALGLETSDYGYSLVYDGSGRIITKNDTGNNPSSTTYAYSDNSTNTISATTTLSSGGTSQAVYYLNASGLLYKKTSGTETEEVSYTGTNILSYTNGVLSSAFVYGGNNDPKGQQHRVALNQFNGNAANALLINGFSALNLGVTKYVTERTDNNGDVFTYEYQFNGDDYPVKVKCFKNGNSIPYFIREVYYE